MKHYLLSIQQPDGEPPPPEVLEPVMQEVEAFNRELKAAGVWVFAGGLHPPSTATVVRLQDGEMLITDGPYIEGKEHVGGHSIITAPDLDAALEWARKLARALTLDQRAGLPVEVRPFQGEIDDHLP
ncbi:MAG: YciI family protein [Chloroflexota bacterium]